MTDDPTMPLPKPPSQDPGETLRPVRPATTGGQTEAILPGTDASAAADLKVSSRRIKVRKLGPYELLGMLGRGGMGAVYEAFDTRLSRRVALKVMLAGDESSPEERERFRREAAHSAKLRHPNIVPVHDVGHEEGRDYLVMDLVEGVTLGEALRQRQFTYREKAALLEKVARAVQYAHDHGVIHRDLKPGNIMLDYGRGGSSTLHGSGSKPLSQAPTEAPLSKAETMPQGAKPADVSERSASSSLVPDVSKVAPAMFEPLVMDFGLAKDTQQESGLSRTGQALGTPAYMAPEQAEGKANLVGPRSDVYSLGAILYEMLAGRPPFVGENALQVMRAALHEEPVPPRVFTPGVPRDLETICLKCLEKEPARRYTSAAEFAEDLKAFQHDEPISARPIGAVERAWKKVRKNPAPYLVAAVAMVVIVAGTAVFMWSLDQKRRDALAQKQIAEGERANALAQKQIAEQREVQAEKARKGAEERQAESLAAQGDALGLAGRWPEAEARYKEAYELFTKLGLSTLPADLGMMDRYRHSPVPLMTIKGKGGGISSVALTPDGRQVLAGGANGQLVLWDVLTGREVRSLKGHQGNVNSVAVSPDGKVALSGGDDKMMRLWDMATGAEVQSFGHPTTKVCRVAFSPNGSLAIAGYGSGPCEIWDVKSGSRIHTLAGPTDGHMRVAFSPNGTKVLSGAWCNRPNNVSLYDVATGQSVCSMDGGFNTNAVAYSPDGSTVLAATARGTFRLWDTTTGRTLPALPSHAGSVECAVFLPDGSAVLAAGSEGILKLTETATRTATKSFFGHGDCVRSVACAEDGRHAVTGSDDGTVRVWPLTNGRDHRVVVVSADNSHSAALSPDGYLAAYPEWLNVRLTDAATGRRLRLLRAHAKNVTLALFSPDSRVLASGGDDFEVIFWSVTDGAQISKSGKLGGEPFSIAFSRDGRLALFGGFRMPAAGLVEIESARRLHSFHVDDVPWGLAFAPDGRTALVGDGGGSVTLWDVTTGLARPSFASKGSSGVGAAAFSPDGRTFITGHYDKTIRLWDASTGQVTQTFRGHTNAVKSVLFFADGKLAVSGSWDNTIKLWHVGSGREMHTFLGHTANIVTVSLSQDGKTMLSAGHDRRLRFWDLSAAHRYREFLPRVEQAIAALQDKPDDAAALATLAEWYYFRNFPDWAAELWERARAAGAKVLSLELARAYWMSDKPAEAKREFLKALEAKESPEYYLKLCLEAVDSKEK